MKHFLIYSYFLILFIAIGTVILACNTDNPPASVTQKGAVTGGDTWYVPPTERFVNASYSHGQLNAVITVERTPADTLYQTYHVSCKREVGPDVVVDVVESKPNL